jgi:hypothetical protein
LDWSQIINGKSQKIVKTDAIDCCATLIGRKNSNPFLKSMIDGMRSSFAGMIHECPYVGFHSFTNVTAERKLVIFAPTGTCNMKLNVTNGKEFLFGFKLLYTTS